PSEFCVYTRRNKSQFDEFPQPPVQNQAPDPTDESTQTQGNSCPPHVSVDYEDNIVLEEPDDRPIALRERGHVLSIQSRSSLHMIICLLIIVL
ncbi:hypothetical protein, partial [Heyndrickxia coagulans]|uniref:hypothetical protein n=1 Tax=Heyndrickxia coagulans TaxID=1398 RepID=UPI00214DE4F2